MRGPGLAAGTRLDSTMRLVDIFPTVLDPPRRARPAERPLLGREPGLGPPRWDKGIGACAASVPPELLKKLRALGYVGGAAPAETTTPGADPQDFEAVLRRGMPTVLELLGKTAPASVQG